MGWLVKCDRNSKRSSCVIPHICVHSFASQSMCKYYAKLLHPTKMLDTRCSYESYKYHIGLQQTQFSSRPVWYRPNRFEWVGRAMQIINAQANFSLLVNCFDTHAHSLPLHNVTTVATTFMALPN